MGGVDTPRRGMNLTNPAALWLLAALPLVWALAWVSRNAHARGRLWSATTVRTLALVLVVLALAFLLFGTFYYLYVKKR